MREVAIVQELLTHYRVPFYERLRPLLAQHQVRLRLLHGTASSERATRSDEGDLSWGEETPISRLSVHGSDLVWQAALASTRKSSLIIVEHANRQLYSHMALAMSITRTGPPIAFWGHGANLQAHNRNSFGEKFKRVTAVLPHWWFAYTEGSAARVRQAGFPSERITVVQNAVETRALSDMASLHPKNPFHCVFIGSLHQHKRIPFLLQAAEEIARREPRFRLSIIGAGEFRPLVEDAARRNGEWLTYWGPLFGASRDLVLLDASLTLNPGLIGLSILDSFAARTPVVTTAIRSHSPEYEYMLHGTNGLAVSASATPEEYAAVVVAALRDHASLERMRAACGEASHKLTVEAMTQRYADGILSALEAPRRNCNRRRRKRSPVG